jgi:hypothetical protein
VTGFAVLTVEVEEDGCWHRLAFVSLIDQATLARFFAVVAALARTGTLRPADP